MSKLKELEELRLNRNQLKSLPNTIGDLKKLKKLNLSWNKLESLPNAIRNLKELEELIISKNPLKGGELERIQELLPETSIIFD